MAGLAEEEFGCGFQASSGPVPQNEGELITAVFILCTSKCILSDVGVCVDREHEYIFYM